LKARTGSSPGWKALRTRPPREAVLAWVAHLLADPDAVPGIPVPGERLPVVVDNVPDTNVWITWLVVDQYRVVRVKGVFEP
jgi:hypothetical protein